MSGLMACAMLVGAVQSLVIQGQGWKFDVDLQ